MSAMEYRKEISLLKQVLVLPDLILKGTHAADPIYKSLGFHEWSNQSFRDHVLETKNNAELEKIRRAKMDAKIKFMTRRLTGKHKGNSMEDPSHPNFPFPEIFPRIDIDKLNSYRLHNAVKIIEKQAEIEQEPIRQHTAKLKEFEAFADIEMKKAGRKFEAPKVKLHGFERPKSWRPSPSTFLATKHMKS